MWTTTHEERTILKLSLILIFNLVGYLLIVMIDTDFRPPLYPYYDSENLSFAKTVSADTLFFYLIFLSPLNVLLAAIASVLSVCSYWQDNWWNKTVRFSGHILIATSVALLIIGVVQLIELWNLNLAYEGGCINLYPDCMEVHRLPSK